LWNLFIWHVNRQQCTKEEWMNHWWWNESEAGCLSVGYFTLLIRFFKASESTWDWDDVKNLSNSDFVTYYANK
jgi:hypothetical protein